MSGKKSKNKGKAFFIKSKEREVVFGPTKVDPNRIFSRTGARKALKKFRPHWDHKELTKLLEKLDESRNIFLFNIFFILFVVFLFIIYSCLFLD